MEKSVSPIIGVVGIVVILSSLSFVVFSSLLQDEEVARGGIIIEENHETGIIEAKIISMGNSDTIILETEQFEHKFNSTGEKFEYAGVSSNFIGVKDNGKTRTLLKQYEPPPYISSKIITDPGFSKKYIEEDSKNSSVKTQWTNTYGESRVIEKMKIEIVSSETTVSHYHNSGNHSNCSGVEGKPLCSIVFVDASTNGWVNKSVEDKIPVYINTDDIPGHEVVQGENWVRPEVAPGVTADFTFYRFQTSGGSDDQHIADLEGEVMYVTMYFENGEAITVQDVID